MPLWFSARTRAEHVAVLAAERMARCRRQRQAPLPPVVSTAALQAFSSNKLERPGYRGEV